MEQAVSAPSIAVPADPGRQGAGASLVQRARMLAGAVLLVAVVVLTFRAYLDPAMLIDSANLRFCS